MDSHDVWVENACATYQRAMNYIFHELIGKIVEIYIDDVVIKSLNHGSHLGDVKRTLECTQKHGLKMNPNKCAFGVSAGEFLGFLVHEGGIEVDGEGTEFDCRLLGSRRPCSPCCGPRTC
jgi:hypothetical protein